MWNASSTQVAYSSWSSIAFLYPWNGSNVPISIPSRNLPPSSSQSR